MNEAAEVDALIAERERVMDMEPAGSLAAQRQGEVIADLSRRINALVRAGHVRGGHPMSLDPERVGELAEALRDCGIGRAYPDIAYEAAQAVAPLIAGWLAEAEERVRADYEGAVTWGVASIEDSKALDKSYESWVAGHEAGIREGAAEVRARVEAVVRDMAGEMSPAAYLTLYDALVTGREEQT